jgi:hypothetical protein
MKAFSTRQIVQDQLGQKRLGHNPSWFKVTDVAPLVKALEAIADGSLRLLDDGHPISNPITRVNHLQSIAKQALEHFNVR